MTTVLQPGYYKVGEKQVAFSIDDYKAMDVASLTVDDALNDTNFNKRPSDVQKYCGIDNSFMESMADFTDGELITFMRAMGEYYNNGTLPDYGSITSTAVKMALRSNIASHKERMEAAYVSAYQSFVKGKKRTQKSS